MSQLRQMRRLKSKTRVDDFEKQDKKYKDRIKIYCRFV